MRAAKAYVIKERWSSAPAENAEGLRKIRLGIRTCLRLREPDPVSGAACSRGCRTAKAAYLQPDPSELLSMPSPTTKDLQEPECLDFNYLVLTGGSNWRIL